MRLSGFIPAVLMAAFTTVFSAPLAAQVIGAKVPGEDGPPAPTLPTAVSDMLDAAIATRDEAKVKTVLDIARVTNPGFSAEFDVIWADFRSAQTLRAKRDARREERAIREASALELWSGRGQIGAFQSSGNSDSVGISAALDLERVGVDWTHKLKTTIDYRRNNGRTQREQFLGSYEPRYQISDRLFAYGLAQFERDRIQGFNGRYSVSGGLGYQVVDEPDMDLSLQAGPAFRYSEFTVGDE